MNYHIFQLCPKGNLAIINKAIVFICSLLICNLSYSQVSEDSLEVAYYQLIKGKMIDGQKSVSKYYAKILQKEVDSGDISKALMDKIINKKLKYKKRLRPKTNNTGFANYLEMDLRIKLTLRNVFGKSFVSEILSRIEADQHHNKTITKNLDITLAQEQLGGSFGHSFSSPIFMDTNRYILYHTFYSTPLSGYSEVLIFCLHPDGSYEIEGVIPISIS